MSSSTIAASEALLAKLLNYTNKISRGRYDIDEKQVQLWFSNKAPVGGKKNCAPTHTSMAHET